MGWPLGKRAGVSCFSEVGGPCVHLVGACNVADVHTALFVRCVVVAWVILGKVGAKAEYFAVVHVGECARDVGRSKVWRRCRGCEEFMNMLQELSTRAVLCKPSWQC